MNEHSYSKKNRAEIASRENSNRMGVYLAEVVDTRDLYRAGTLNVFIPMLEKDPDTGGRYAARWTSPFAGSTNPKAIGPDVESYEQTQKSYGMWMVPPDPGNLVLVAFADGNVKRPFVISCLYSDTKNHMVPGIPHGKNYSDPTLRMPVAEKSKFDGRQTNNDAIRPAHSDLAESIVTQGLLNDPLRGAGTSGARRESPSEVFGFLTPGPIDRSSQFGHRLGGHQFVMDDSETSRLIRIRSSQGNQILLDDNNGLIYMINKNGTAWVELTGNGDIHIFGDGSINMRAKQNFNIRADQNVNIEAGQNVNIKAAGDNTGGEYTGGPSAPGSPTNGNGGNINLEAASDMNQYANANWAASAFGGDIDFNSGGDMRVLANGLTGLELVAKNGQLFTQSATATHILSTSVSIGGAAGVPSTAVVSITAPQVLINSAGPPALPAPISVIPTGPGASRTAKQIGTNSKKDAAQDPAEFVKNPDENAPQHAPTGGLRTGKQAEISTIVGTLVTAEPFAGHGQVKPIEMSEYEPEPSQEEIDALPPAAVDLSGKPVDVQTPAGSKAGTGYTDNSGNVLSNQSPIDQAQAQAASGTAGGGLGSATGSTADQLAGVTSGIQEFLDGIPTFEDIQNVINNFANAAEQKFLEITGLGAVIDQIKAAIPSIRFPVINAIQQEIIGLQKQLTELESNLKQFAMDQLGQIVPLQDLQIKKMREAIKDAIALAAAVGGTFAAIQAALADKGISVIQDGSGLVYQDAAGNKVVDFSNGIGPIGATLGLVADLNSSFESVKSAIKVPVNENQTAAIASFVNNIGEEAFLKSNVLEALNQGKYEEVPRLMQGWVLGSSTDQSVKTDLQARRRWESSLFQSPDEMDLDVLPNSDSENSVTNVTFGELADSLDATRAEFYRNKIQKFYNGQ